MTFQVFRTDVNDDMKFQHPQSGRTGIFPTGISKFKRKKCLAEFQEFWQIFSTSWGGSKFWITVDLLPATWNLKMEKMNRV